jgi:hypothetical protein
LQNQFVAEINVPTFADRVFLTLNSRKHDPFFRAKLDRRKKELGQEWKMVAIPQTD